ncbi:HD domain containing protein [Acanthamoeba castellanii str. Neff]|uniref:HD domain containing protein n=1 Tax=Acanthamoeba castellanii (strain ATCC 30010 / Neff) TaxID=1257118 RepID=L8HE54_ACACF|nr:HD domain containing protein [Acanthamoeba castellanii str. Neff]ELR23470.1 HD domain containing protein [Acanthamoeba castellanii str. Neff]
MEQQQPIAAPAPASIAAPAASSLLDFMCLMGKLKHLKRTGWVRHNVSAPECIADHMYRMGIMAMLFADSSLNKERMVKLALLSPCPSLPCHGGGGWLAGGWVGGWVTAIVGDITPHCGVTKDEKYRLEHEAMGTIRAMLAGLPAADEFEELWLEYEKGETPEARVVGQIDKFDMYLQAHEYEASQGLDLSEFFRGAETTVQHPEMRQWLAELLARRQQPPSASSPVASAPASTSP